LLVFNLGILFSLCRFLYIVHSTSYIV
jgi:hypothetical protein